MRPVRIVSHHIQQLASASASAAADQADPHAAAGRGFARSMQRRSHRGSQRGGADELTAVEGGFAGRLAVVPGLNLQEFVLVPEVGHPEPVWHIANRKYTGDGRRPCKRCVLGQQWLVKTVDLWDVRVSGA